MLSMSLRILSLLDNLFSTVKAAPVLQSYSFYMVEVGKGWDTYDDDSNGA